MGCISLPAASERNLGVASWCGGLIFPKSIKSR
jgi:hypothetical protein